MTDSTNELADARELAILTAACSDPESIDRMAWLRPDAFRSERGALVWSTMLAMRRQGLPIDPVSIADHIQRCGGDLREHLGDDWRDFLWSLAGPPLTADPESYAQAIQADHERRRLRQTLEAATVAVNDPAVKPSMILRRIEAAIEQQSTGEAIPALTSQELDAGDFALAYLVEDVLVAGQPCIFAAPKKCLKTNIAIDLTLSLASGSQFLRTFPVPRPVRVGLISGESGKATIQETARRVARSKPWFNLADYANAVWSFDLPSLSDPGGVLALRQFIRRHRLEVVVLDPAYLMLQLGDDAGNLFKVGEVLWPLSRMAAEERVTPIIVHHTKQSVSVTDGPPELDGIAWAGFQEWARQWLLLARRAKYDPDRVGHHELWFTAGGSAGHSTAKAIDVEEGDRRDQSGRRWEVTVSSIGSAVAEKLQTADAVKQARQEQREARQIENAVAKVRTALEQNPAGVTARRLREEYRVAPWLQTLALQRLKETGETVDCVIVAGNNRPYDGWRLAKFATGCNGEQRESPQSDPVPPADIATGEELSPLYRESSPLCVRVMRHPSRVLPLWQPGDASQSPHRTGLRVLPGGSPAIPHTTTPHAGFVLFAAGWANLWRPIGLTAPLDACKRRAIISQGVDATFGTATGKPCRSSSTFLRNLSGLMRRGGGLISRRVDRQTVPLPAQRFRGVLRNCGSLPRGRPGRGASIALISSVNDVNPGCWAEVVRCLLIRSGAHGGASIPFT